MWRSYRAFELALKSSFQNLHHKDFSCYQICICPFSTVLNGLFFGPFLGTPDIWSMQNSPLQLPTEPDCLLQGLARRCKSILPVQWTANIEQSHYCFHFYVSLSLAHHYNEHCHLFSNIEVDCVKVHVVRGSGESQTGGRVEKLSGKGCAIIVTIHPPGNRKGWVKKAKFLIWAFLFAGQLQTGVRNPRNFFQIYRPINDRWQAISISNHF